MIQQAPITLEVLTEWKSKEDARPANALPPAILIELAQRFQARWELVTELPEVHDAESRVGFTLELSGRHDSSGDHAPTNCIHCHNIFLFLHVIAERLFPRRDSSVMSEVEILFPYQIDSPARQTSSGVRLAIRVARRKTSPEVAEVFVARWRRESEWNLKELGFRSVQGGD
jgi:hypothetical protein